MPVEDWQGSPFALQRAPDVFGSLEMYTTETRIRKPQATSSNTAKTHFNRIKQLAHGFGMTAMIPYYIQTQPEGEQKALLRYSKRWLLRYWDQKTLKLKQPYYLALIGELNDLPLHLSVANYACYQERIAASHPY
ncbi:hypothetical protein S7335_971 [Synechococcus sp. PCC 7335]|uniref:hypothetical protein n=1 Tax=Synechococcus sp. (strain ATCC 29403 / PCC 7335) TaxID=91464 RepID=UPI00017EC815|nr:hypothetical protein [Synechococcus sp. PCC 7335]EDX82670.1 hypothetical protein S7335_971 [Synechococcus sp. PCC 7335]